MWLYLTIFFGVVLLYMSSINIPQSRGLLMSVMTFLAIFVGISDMLGGYDRYIYGELFDSMADDMRSGGLFETTLFQIYGNELGYCLLNLGVGLFSANRYIFILVATLIIYSCLYVSFKRHTNNYAFAIILFLGLWFFFSFTYLRQVLGASIGWLALKYVSERDLKRFLVIVFIAATFHNSAIMLLPLYFVPIRAFDRKKILMVMGVLLLLGLSGGPGALFDAYGSAVEDSRVQNNIDDSSGFRIAYFIEAAFFLYFILKNYELVTETEEQTVMTNAALIFCGILLFFVKSENGGRISWYYMIGIISTLTYIATWQQRVTNTAIVLIFVSLFLYMRVYTSWQLYLNLYPYKTFFTNGYREGDYSWMYYEYDNNYDVDKFYR
jgi:hypothetical protein